MLVNPTDYLLYSPLLPEVATGVVEARHIAVSLRRLLPRVRLVLGRVSDVDLASHTVTVQPSGSARDDAALGPAGAGAGIGEPASCRSPECPSTGGR